MSVGWIIWILFVVFFFVMLTLIAREEGIKKRRIWLNKFEKEGFKVSENFIQNLKNLEKIRGFSPLFVKYQNNWTVTKGGDIFQIKVVSNGEAEIFEVRYRLPRELAGKSRIRIENRGFFSKAFGWNKGDYHHLNEDLKITGSNIMLVKELMNKRDNLKIIKNLTRRGVKIRLFEDNEFKLPLDIDILTKSLQNFIDLTKKIEELVNTTTNDDFYTLEEILEDFDFDNTELKCIICYQHVASEKVRILNCCSSIGHLLHLKEWFAMNGACPMCKKQNFTILNPLVQPNSSRA